MGPPTCVAFESTITHYQNEKIIHGNDITNDFNKYVYNVAVLAPLFITPFASSMYVVLGSGIRTRPTFARNRAGGRVTWYIPYQAQRRRRRERPSHRLRFQNRSHHHHPPPSKFFNGCANVPRTLSNKDDDDQAHGHFHIVIIIVIIIDSSIVRVDAIMCTCGILAATVTSDR